jgi:phage/plasmid primase-like uncharacterized protein
MDGQRHRVQTEGDGKGELAGFYVGYLDGQPAGYVKNNRTGVEVRWKAKGYHLAATQRDALKAEFVAKLEERAAAQADRHEATADRLTRQIAALVPVRTPLGYLRTKRIQAHPGVWTDKAEKTLYVPAFDVSGKQWTTQYIHEDGTKRFAKDSRKEGCFHAVNGMAALDKASVVLVAEGYATAATLAEATGHAAVAAFDCGNLVHVALAIRQKYPSKTILIAGDNDAAVESERGINPGRAGAQEAARCIDAKAVFPIFAPGECTANKRLTDFNDLANNSLLGIDGVRRQISAAVDECAQKQQTGVHLKPSRGLSLAQI